MKNRFNYFFRKRFRISETFPFFIVYVILCIINVLSVILCRKNEYILGQNKINGFLWFKREIYDAQYWGNFLIALGLFF